MDIRENIIKDVILKLQEKLNDEQLKSVKDSLYINLNNYEISERCTSLTIPDTSNQILLKQFIATKNIEGKASSTLKRYYYICNRMLLEINKPLSEINTFDLRFYLASYKQTHSVSDRSLDGMRRCIKSFFTFLFNENIIDKNPSASLSQIKYEKTIKKSFSAIDMEKLKRNCTNLRDRAIIEFLYSTGCRVSEAVALDRNNINFQNRTVIVKGKGNKQRIVYLTDVCLMYLSEYFDSRKDKNPCLFASIRKPYNRITKNGIEAMLHKLGDSAGVANVHPHRFRRTLTTNLLDRGANIQDVAVILGHEDIKTTQIYNSISQQNIQITYNRYVS